MEAGPSIQGSFLVGAFLGVMLYGLYACLFTLTMIVMKRQNGAARTVKFVMVSLFSIATVSIFLQIADIYEAFVKREKLGGPLPYFANRHERKLATAIDTLILVSGILADGLISWRLYVIWDRNKLVLAVPLVILFAGSVCGAIAVGYEIHQTVIGDSRFMSKVDLWALIAFGISVITNLLMTGLIAGRIWRIARFVSPLNQASHKLYTNAVAALIESGAVYSLTITLFVILAAAGQTAPRIVISYTLPMVVGIAPTIIILRLNLGAPGSRFGSATTNPSTNLPASNLTFARATTTQMDCPSVMLNGLNTSAFNEEYGTKFSDPSSSTVQIELHTVPRDEEAGGHVVKTLSVVRRQSSSSLK